MIARTIIADEAAEYVGCKSTPQFRREVAEGVWPEPIAKKSRPQRWSTFSLDQRLHGGVVQDDNTIVEELDMELGLK
jgi:hypothetical protein